MLARVRPYLGHPSFDEKKNEADALEGLDHAVEENPIEAAVAEPDAIVVVLVERVHGVLPCGEIPGAYAMSASTGARPRPPVACQRRWDQTDMNGGAQPRASAASDSRSVGTRAEDRGDIKGAALG